MAPLTDHAKQIAVIVHCFVSLARGYITSSRTQSRYRHGAEFTLYYAMLGGKT